jgi:hypothetical protein
MYTKNIYICPRSRLGYYVKWGTWKYVAKCFFTMPKVNETITNVRFIPNYILHILLIHTYHSRFIPEGVAEVSQIFLRDTLVLPKLLISYEEHCKRDMWLAHRRLIAVYLRCKCYIHAGKREVLIFILSRTPHETFLVRNSFL